MEEMEKKEKASKQVTKVRIFTVPFTLGEFREDFIINTNTLSKELIINQAIKLHVEGNILEAEKYYKYCLE